MADYWYYWTSGGNFRKGINDAEDGLPKIGENGAIHIPPHLDAIKDRYESVMVNVVKRWSSANGDLTTKVSYLEKRKEQFNTKKADKDYNKSRGYFVLIIMLAILELPITFIALESIFKENIILTVLGSIAFSALIVGLGDILGQMIYKEGILKESSRLTIMLVTCTILTIAGLSYFRYVYQSNQNFREIQRIEEEAQLDGSNNSAIIKSKIDHLNSTSPALISIVFFFMSSGFTLVALFLSKQHCTRRKDKVFVDEMLEFVDEKLIWIGQQRQKLYVALDCDLQVLIQSAQREFAEYKDGLIRGSQNTGDLMLKLEKTITEIFAIEIGHTLKSFPALAEKLQKDIEIKARKLDDYSIGNETDACTVTVAD